jgi:hypothetical protein
VEQRSSEPSDTVVMRPQGGELELRLGRTNIWCVGGGVISKNFGSLKIVSDLKPRDMLFGGGAGKVLLHSSKE